ncbi:MAG: NADH-quinone oxidoreductase subunit I [Candidatus Micrarchaeaceae archaeon]
MSIIKGLIKSTCALFEKPFTLMYPQEKEVLADNYRGIHKLDMETCISCAACARICPNSTITMEEIYFEGKERKMPSINLERCLFCGLCEEVCPTKCLILTKNYDFERTDRREFVLPPQELT